MRPPASYNPRSDLIKLARKTTYTKNYKGISIKNMLHELGHRAFNQEFVNSSEVKNKYKEIKSKQKTEQAWIPSRSWIPSKYSLTNEKEWFAEVFAYGLFQNINRYKEFIKKIWKR